MRSWPDAHRSAQIADRRSDPESGIERVPGVRSFVPWHRGDMIAGAGLETDRAGLLAHQPGQPVHVLQVLVDHGLAGADLDHPVLLVRPVSALRRRFDVRYVAWPGAPVPGVAEQ